MKFDELDAKMRVFETAHDLCVLPGVFGDLGPFDSRSCEPRTPGSCATTPAGAARTRTATR